jgi:hypothetical protein
MEILDAVTFSTTSALWPASEASVQKVGFPETVPIVQFPFFHVDPREKKIFLFFGF